jgi:hypothetical protein
MVVVLYAFSFLMLEGQNKATIHNSYLLSTTTTTKKSMITTTTKRKNKEKSDKLSKYNFYFLL